MNHRSPRRSKHRASRLRTRVSLAVATTVATIAGGSLLLASSPSTAATLTGDLDKSTHTRTHQLDLTPGTLAATLKLTPSPELRNKDITAKVTLVDPDGDRVKSVWGKSPVELSSPITEAGSYQLEVSTAWPLNQGNVSYSLTTTLTPKSGTSTPTSPTTPTTPSTPPATTPTTPTTGSNKAAVHGTWVLLQVTSATDLERQRTHISDALALPGVVGFSVRFPWNAADLTGSQTTNPILDTAYDIAHDAGKALSIRFMAGAHTPARVFDAGAAYYTVGGQKVPLPWDNASGSHQVFLKEYAAYAGKLAAWSEAHGVRLLHMSWYGKDWAELNNGAEVRAVPGYTQDTWLAGHKDLIDVAASLSSSDLAVELPLSGYGPLSGGQSDALASYIVDKMGANSDRFFIQANGWNETQQWGAPNMTVESQFDKIWSRPVSRGVQMIQPDGYDWTKVFAQLTAINGTYGEIYLPSFWQVPGPTAQYNHNTTARVAQLDSEIAKFGKS